MTNPFPIKHPIKTVKHPVKTMERELKQAGHSELVGYVRVWMSYRSVKLQDKCPLYMSVDTFLPIMPKLKAYETERANKRAAEEAELARRRAEYEAAQEAKRRAQEAERKAFKEAQADGNLISTCKAAADFMGITLYRFRKLNITPDFVKTKELGGVRFFFKTDTLKKAM